MRIKPLLQLLAPAVLAMGAAPAPSPSEAADARLVAAMDTAYQAAVERNDADAMAVILHPKMTLVVGAGTVYSREDLLTWARTAAVVYEHQVEDPGTQTVRIINDGTAIVTARLWIKGVRGGVPFERRLWFSDTYVKTPEGWRYAFGQASLALPEA
jgi:ketosteroid isomerase-like protein